MGDLCRLIWSAVVGLFRSRAALQAEILFLRHHLNVLRRRSPKRVALSNIDRLVFAGLYAKMRRRGELSPAGIDRGWPYQVVLPARFCENGDYKEIHDFCDGLGLCTAATPSTTANGYASSTTKNDVTSTIVGSGRCG